MWSIILCVDGCLLQVCLHCLYAWCCWGLEGVWPPGTGVSYVLSWHKGAENQTQVLWKKSQCYKITESTLQPPSLTTFPRHQFICLNAWSSEGKTVRVLDIPGDFEVLKAQATVSSLSASRQLPQDGSSQLLFQSYAYLTATSLHATVDSQRL